ncbi:hypothetical protein B0H10DRAFT_1939511 [Mycena sp. CBHHK59/15]|nr:hypothetical protein B0H10DRAFT_1939511 [Mycena sp. CBHHK59/15]
MPAPKPSAPGPSVLLGIPREINTCINHLATLLKHLPISIPLDPPDSKSTYHFGLDPEDVKQEGMIYTFNRNLEVSFQTHKLYDGTLIFKEHVKRLVALEKLIKRVVKETMLPDACSHQVRWIDRLITATVDSGAKMPNVAEMSPPDEMAWKKKQTGKCKGVIQK